MSFFVKCPKQRPVHGRFKKVPFDKLMVLSKVEGHMYGAIEDKGTLPFGLESFYLEALDRLRAERLLHHFETAHYCEFIGHYKKRHTHAPQTRPASRDLSRGGRAVWRF